MKIKVGYDTKSIEKAIKQIEEYQRKLNSIIPTFLYKCAEKVQELASQRLVAVGVGANIEAEILSKWEITEKDNAVLLQNTSQKATYIEFGVGQVGAESPHPLSGELAYRYNLPSSSKWSNPYSGETQWYISFHSEEDIDLAKTYFERLTEPKYVNRKRKYIRTSGQPATLFLYQAMQDFIDYKLFLPIIEELLKGLD